MRSALSNPAVVADYLLEEGRAGRLIGPLIKSPAVMPQVGVIPKGSQPGRLIVDLHGSSVNDGIDESLCSLSYVSVDDVARKILELGTGSEMAKLDITSAYRIVPIHPGDRPLLGRYFDIFLKLGFKPHIIYRWKEQKIYIPKILYIHRDAFRCEHHAIRKITNEMIANVRELIGYAKQKLSRLSL